MRVRPIIVAVALIFGAGMSGVMAPALAGQPRSVIELFTSQGCSSCPPADRLLGRLTQDPPLIALSVPVDYWDYLGWKDILVLHKNSVRQRGYAVTRGDREVYTPQVVVNGMVQVLGSDKSAIETAIAKTRPVADPLSLPVGLHVEAGIITVQVPAAADRHRSGEVWLCPVTGKGRVSIGHGENRGRTIVYHNVVRRWIKLGDWHGQAQTFRVKFGSLPDASRSPTSIAPRCCCRAVAGGSPA